MEYISNLFYTFFDKIAVGLKVYLNSNTYIGKPGLLCAILFSRLNFCRMFWKVGKDDEELSRQISSYFRFTYRYGFETIEGTKLSSDSGWGCMARVAQMMMARVLYLHLMGKGKFSPVETFKMAFSFDIMYCFDFDLFCFLDWIFSKANISPEKWVVHNQVIFLISGVYCQCE